MRLGEFTKTTKGSFALLLGIAATAAFCFVPAPAAAEEELIGSDEYMNSCLACHGVGGKGNGPMAEYLTVEPTDLTRIAAENDGIFPLLDVFQIVDGRSIVGAHGVREAGTVVGSAEIRNSEAWEMPVWGDRYMKDVAGKYGPYGTEQAVRARILELVFYIQSIQQY
ncbi:c-type cytochrome [Aliiruegeria lutimaris]|uniref:Cytochrome c domain-containing protein n=1 Tax=Aliiruegeria lutimaris TaxID=571298 RepID=A0A1G9HB81_9RHOB|nr:cytochrome c [Aliiruegeria lutimaris]SDL10004.1 hypothetical protein SAMN04488026_106730 [Aliiruegeria lutimaris]